MQDVDSIKNNVSRSAYLHDLAFALHHYTKDIGGSHCSSTAIEGVTIFRSEDAMQAVLQFFRPAIFITIEIPEWSFLRERPYDHRVDEALFVTIGVPCSGPVPVASLKLPYVGLVMELNRAYTREVIEEVGIRLKPTSNHRASGASVLELSPQLFGLCPTKCSSSGYPRSDSYAVPRDHSRDLLLAVDQFRLRSGR